MTPMSVGTVFAVALCNMVGMRASKVGVALFGLALGANPLQIGVLVALYSLFPMLLALHLGRFSDRFGMRVPMLCGSLGMAGGMAVPWLSPTLPGLYVSAAAIGASHIFYHVSIQSLVGQLSSPENRARNFTSYALILSAGGFIGPLAAGFGIDAFGHERAYLALMVIPLLSVLMLARSGKTLPAPKVSAEAASARNATDLWRLRDLRRVFLTSALILSGIDLYQFYLPIYGRSIGLSASVIGIVLSMFSAAAFLVRSVMPPLVRRLGEEGLLRYTLAVAALGFLVLPLMGNAWLLGAISFLVGLGLGCGQPVSTILVYARSPEGRSGEALGLRIAVNNFIHLAVPLAFGIVGTALGVAPVFVANAVMLASGSYLSRAGPAERSPELR
jgi:MFS family permease